MEMEVDEDISFKPLSTLKEKHQLNAVRRSSRIARTSDASSVSNAATTTAPKFSIPVQDKSSNSRDPSPSPSVDGRESHREFSVPTPSTSATRRTGRKIQVFLDLHGVEEIHGTKRVVGLKIEKENATSVAMRNKDAMARHKDRMMRKSLNTPN